MDAKSLQFGIKRLLIPDGREDLRKNYYLFKQRTQNIYGNEVICFEELMKKYMLLTDWGGEK
ncbi:MAG: hypothetical protein F6K24_19550 [Okeania sp. SIO2D1]|nr:hypothetical protein [Okeania sp. SIO2D1]